MAVETAGNKTYNPTPTKTDPKDKDSKDVPFNVEVEPDLEVKEEDKKYDTYPAEVKAAYNRNRLEAILRNKFADMEQKRRNGLVKEVVVEPEPVSEDKKEEKDDKNKVGHSQEKK